MFTFNQIAQILGYPQGKSEQVIQTFLYDSRMHIEAEVSALFIALSTASNDGHLYINGLIDQGVKHFIIDKPAYLNPNAHFILVKDSLEALQKLAAHYRKHQINGTVIGITGSNGKTIVKDQLAQIMTAAHISFIKSPRSFNSQLGVAISLLQNAKKATYAIIEAGISKEGEMQQLQQMIDPTIGIITHLGDAHEMGFASISSKIKEKCSSFSASKIIFINANNKYLAEVKAIFTSSDKLKVVHYIADEQHIVVNGTKFNLPEENEVILNNIALAIATAQHLGISKKNIQEGALQKNHQENRLTLLNGVEGAILINDTYTNDLEALQAAIDFTNKQAGSLKKVAIVTDLESGNAGQKITTMLGDFEKVYSIGPGFAANNYADVNAFLNIAEQRWFAGKVILIKGLRKHQLEKISRWLQAKKNTTVLEINMDKWQQNFKGLKSCLKSGTKAMIMLKAQAYGSGAHQISRFLDQIKPDYIGVAHIDEGLALRKEGVKYPILVLYTTADDAEILAQYQLEPVVFSMEYLYKLVQPAVPALKLHIEFDTGMHRLGFYESQLNDIAKLLAKSKHKVAGIMSHLSCADDPSMDDFTRKVQIQGFQKISTALEQALGYPTIKHLSNSIATQRFPEAHFDMVRLGIGVYGFVSANAQSIVQLKTQIVQIKTINAGEGIGYGCLDQSASNRNIAIIPIGYADGFDRGLGNGRWHVVVNKVKCPTVGNICMDMTMIDVSGVKCQPDDTVLLFGEEIPVEQMAKTLTTIPYEVISRISERVKRIYISE